MKLRGFLPNPISRKGWDNNNITIKLQFVMNFLERTAGEISFCDSS